MLTLLPAQVDLVFCCESVCPPGSVHIVSRSAEMLCVILECGGIAVIYIYIFWHWNVDRELNVWSVAEGPLSSEISTLCAPGV